MLEAGFPIHHVQHMLGHGNVQTTDTYLNVTKLGLKESMRQYDVLRVPCKPVAKEQTDDPKATCNEDSAVRANPQIN
jgi:hypothetical protein